MSKKPIFEEEFEDQRIEHTTIMPMFGDNMLDLSFVPEKCTPERLPLVALRQMVMFPGLTMPLSVGRTKSIRVVKEAEKNKLYIGVVCQKNTVDDPGRDDLYDYGVVCEVMKELELPDGSHSVIIQGRRAFHLEELLTTEPFLTGEVTLLDDEMLQPRSRRTKALLSIIRDDIKAINECADNPITGEIMFAMNNVTDANFLINYLSATFPMALHNHQQLLEFRSLEQR